MTAAATLPVAAAFAVRGEEADDRRFVLATWKRAEAESLAHQEGRYFVPFQEEAMRLILSRPSTRVLIASPEGDDTIAGWAVLGSQVTAPVIYYIYVRPESRRLGLARLLLGSICERQDVIYTSRPARERDHEGVWRSSPVPIPRAWRYLPRAAFLEIPQ
jgi:ribosomal protein S18 acetylase RimI-like enzyme